MNEHKKRAALIWSVALIVVLVVMAREIWDYVQTGG